MKVLDIIWETNGEDIDLPTEMEIPDSIDPDDDDEISDYLFDETCFFAIAYKKENEY